MYGFQLDGDMLLSFSGELGNMIVGHLSTLLADWGYNMEITPPTVLVGQTEIHGFDKGFQLPVHIKEIGDIQILLMLETL
jgi:CheC-like family.